MILPTLRVGLKATWSKRFLSTAQARASNFTKYPRRLGWGLAASTTLATGATIYMFSSPVIQNDARTPDTPPRGSQTDNSRLSTKQAIEASPGLSPLVWGSNANHLLAPDQPTSECFRLPVYMPELFSAPLRDIKFSREHAACVDASGDVYQWGDGFFGPEAETADRKPVLTLRGKNIISVSVTPTKIFGLAASGEIYALSSSSQEQPVSKKPSRSWLWFLEETQPQPHHSVLDTDIPLRSGEKFTSISAGSDHLLALTSQGRAFAHPVTRHANLRGQLGVRKVSVQDPGHPQKRLPVELVSVTPGDNLRGGSRDYQSEAEPEEPVNDKRVGYCNRLFEIPALQDIKIKKIVAGERSSYVITEEEGRVLAWGANEFGQLGLGANITTPNVLVPAEVILTKFTKRSVLSRCVDICSAGDLTFFTVERQVPFTKSKVVDVLACGNGQWGGLGNATYSTAQGEPTKVKELSGLLEYDEETQTLQPLRPYFISVAPAPTNQISSQVSNTSGHVIAMLDTIPRSHPQAESEDLENIALPPGRDVLAWGLNQHSQLGNGKRSSSSMPVPCQTSDGEGRLMCKMNKQTVKDFKGKVVKRKASIEQRVVAGPGFSMIYWKISD